MKTGKIELSNLNGVGGTNFKSENLSPDDIVLCLLYTAAKVSQHYHVTEDELPQLLQQLMDDPSIGSIDELREELMSDVK